MTAPSGGLTVTVTLVLVLTLHLTLTMMTTVRIAVAVTRDRCYANFIHRTTHETRSLLFVRCVDATARLST